MLNAIQLWVKGTLDGLASPQLPPLVAVVMPPVDADIAIDPIAYIWAADGDEQRMSAPRPIGWQKITWDVDVALLSVMEIDDPNVETAFPLLVDQVTAAVNTLAMPYVLVDPVTEFQTQIVSLGERLHIRHARIRTTSAEGQGLVKLGAEFTLHVEEDVSYMPGSYYALNRLYHAVH